MSKSLLCFIAVIIVSTLQYGCSLEGLPAHGDACPPDDKMGQLGYILFADMERCNRNGNCYGDSFEYDVCPETAPKCYRDTDKNYYCRTACPANSIACNGECIKPESDPAFCGAKGGCYDDDENSDDFRGVSCKSYQSCISGMCVKVQCGDNQHDFGDDCEDDSVRHCGSHDNNCENIAGWLSGSCNDGKCFAEKCSDEFIPVDGACVVSHDCDTIPEWCMDDGVTRLYCHGSEVRKEVCKNDERCFNGKCEQRIACNQADPPSCFDEATVSVCGDDLFLHMVQCGDNHMCYQGACFHESLCENGECFDPTPIGGECASNTFENKCNPPSSGIIYCEYDAVKDGDVYKLIDCAADGKICKNAKCVCDESEPPRCVDNHTVRACQEDGDFVDLPCPPGDLCNRGLCQTPSGSCHVQDDCSTSETCIENQCVFTPKCLPGVTESVCINGNTQIKFCNDKGDYEIMTCRFDEVCDGKSGSPKCVSRRGQFCDDNNFKKECAVDGEDSQYLVQCVNSRISFSRCPENNFCADFDGSVDCFLACDQAADTACLISSQSDKPIYGVCREISDAKGKKRLVFQYYDAYCDPSNEYSNFCIYDTTKKTIKFEILCRGESTSSQCSSDTGLCAAFASCAKRSASCDEQMATNCIPNPAGDGFILLKTSCGSAPCDIIHPTGDKNAPLAKCYETVSVELETGEVILYSTFGACHDDGTIRIFVPKGAQRLIKTCYNERAKDVSVNGREYCYCL